MRREFISFEAARVIDPEIGKGRKPWWLFPWACIIRRVEGGWIAFASPDDYLVWRSQK